MNKHSKAIIAYDHLITTRPHDIQQVVISDLHLSDDAPALVQAFASLLDDLIALPNLQKLFIAGDWFDAWIGDDAYLSLDEATKQAHWITPLIMQLRQLQQNGCRVLIMHGNRDFLIGQKFCDSFGGQLIDEPYALKIGGQRFRLEHGDALCTDDTAYQRFRRLMRNPVVQKLLLSRTLAKRQQMARNLRQKSRQHNSQKAQYVMDVNDKAVAKASKGFDALLHGHTHRPDIHVLKHIEPHRTALDKLIKDKLIKDKLTNIFSANLTDNKLGQAITRPVSKTLKHNAVNKTLAKKLKPDSATNKIRYVLGDWRVINKDRTHQRVEAIIGVVLGSNTSRQSRASFVMVQFKF